MKIRFAFAVFQNFLQFFFNIFMTALISLPLVYCPIPVQGARPFFMDENPYETQGIIKMQYDCLGSLLLGYVGIYIFFNFNSHYREYVFFFF